MSRCPLPAPAGLFPVRRPIPALLGILLPASAWAHTPASADPWRWNLEPWLLVLLAASALLYARGVHRLWGEAGRGRGILPGTVACFAAGWLTLVVALVTPLDTLGGLLFSAHMVQHELLMVLAAPLLVLGRPLAAWTWAFAPATRQRLGRAVQTRWVAAPWRGLTDPLVAWGLHALILWAWHVPWLFGTALRHQWVHELQHATFLASALLFWWTALGGDPRGARSGIGVASLFTTMLHTAVLGALLSLAPSPWYPPYVETAGALGWDPLEDQQLGGLLMWVPAGLAYIVAALVLLGRILARPAARRTP